MLVDASLCLKANISPPFTVGLLLKPCLSTIAIYAHTCHLLIYVGEFFFPCLNASCLLTNVGRYTSSNCTAAQLSSANCNESIYTNDQRFQGQGVNNTAWSAERIAGEV